MSFVTDITDLRQTVRSELVKLKHNPILVTVVVLPLVIITLIALLSESRAFAVAGANPWASMAMSVVSFWSGLMVFLAPMITAMVAGMEHNNNMWKHLFALPVSRRAVYLAKVVVNIVLFGISWFVLLVTIFLVGFIFRIIKPDSGFQTAIPFDFVLGVMFFSFVGSWFMIALHTWAGTRFRSFGPAMSFGLIAFLINFSVANRADILPKIYPWLLSSNFFNKGLDAALTGDFLNEGILVSSVAVSVIGCLVVTALAAWETTRHDVA
jgi:hypothetical protein